MPQFKKIHLSSLSLPIPRSSQSQSQSHPNITPAPNLPWSLVGPGKDHLIGELERFYWEGIEREIENIIRTLRIWQRPEYADIRIDEEDDDHVHGFDTFLDQVSHEARAFAIRYGEERERLEAKEEGGKKALLQGVSKDEALRRCILDRKAEVSSAKIKSRVREEIEELTPQYSGLEKRAFMLLQAAGFLDIEKLIEHRPPLKKLGLWTRPAIPQLALSEFDEYWTPRFKPLQCTKCTTIITGSMFTATSQSSTASSEVICEDCYLIHYYGNDGYVKTYKHCILSEAITPATSRKICHCKDVPHFDETGAPRSLFPVDTEEKHLDVNGAWSVRCSILKLGELVALSKYDGLQTVVGIKKKQRSVSKVLSARQERRKEEYDRAEEVDKNQKKGSGKDEKTGTELKKVSGWRPNPLKRIEGTSLHDIVSRSAASGSTNAATEAMADGDIPLFFRQFVEKYPFGNVHMALRVGPLVIENGVAHTKGGALITHREFPVLHHEGGVRNAHQHNFAVGGDADRLLWRQQQQRIAAHKPKRYKAIMKQVVGAPFSGILPQELEKEVIQLIVAASRRPFDDPGLPTSDQERLLHSAMSPVLEKLKVLLESRLKVYMQSIVQRLLDPIRTITWSATSNNCQTFCDSLIDTGIFAPLVNGHSDITKTTSSPLYLMSFVCPQEGYMRNRVRTKFDVPSGLTEEYLLRCHFGRHDESDIIDTLHEYWYDWGAFGGPLYRYQDLFPWDCTEAYGRYPVRCGSCNLAKHVWAFPFDSWSIISLHLARDWNMYAPPPPHLVQGGGNKKQEEYDLKKNFKSWMRNRLLVLAASSILTRAAAAMSKTPSFCSATSWLHSNLNTTNTNINNDNDTPSRNDPFLTRVKLGGIHRAQPFSHYFEAGTYSHFFISEWALRSRPEQIAAYELLRDGRVKLPDVPRRLGGQFSFSSRSTTKGRDERIFGFGGQGDPGPQMASDTPGALDGGVGAAGVGVVITDAQLGEAGLEAGTSDIAGSSCAAGCSSNCGSGCGSGTMDTGGVGEGSGLGHDGGFGSGHDSSFGGGYFHTTFHSSDHGSSFGHGHGHGHDFGFGGRDLGGGGGGM